MTTASPPFSLMDFVVPEETPMSAYPRNITERSVGNADQQSARWVGDAAPPTDAIVMMESDPTWPESYRREADRVVAVLGDEVVRIEHVGSTSVPGLPAKPIIDIDLQVLDSDAEQAYIPALERVGYTHVLREPWWNGHRMLVRDDGRINLHVFPAGSPEPLRHLLFRDWLRTHTDDRDLYGSTKKRLAAATADDPDSYNLAKNDVIDEIYSRIFSVPPHTHPAWPTRPISAGGRPS
ncbi:GrpB family protein [Leifsonia flava]|nr:GrpB family protein [Leifsonia flava]